MSGDFGHFDRPIELLPWILTGQQFRVSSNFLDRVIISLRVDGGLSTSISIHTHTLYMQIKITPRARSASPYIEIEMGLPGKASDRLLAISIFAAIVLADTWAALCRLGYYVRHIQLGSSQPRLNLGPTPIQTPLDPCGSVGLDNPTGTPSEPQSLLSTVALCMCLFSRICQHDTLKRKRQGLLNK